METLERSYGPAAGARSRQVRLVHVLRNDGGPRRYRNGRASAQTWCGQSAEPRRQAGPGLVVREAPHELPLGLSWCPRCVGLLAGHLDRVGEIAVLLGLAPGSRAPG